MTIAQRVYNCAFEDRIHKVFYQQEGQLWLRVNLSAGQLSLSTKINPRTTYRSKGELVDSNTNEIINGFMVYYPKHAAVVADNIWYSLLSSTNKPPIAPRQIEIIIPSGAIIASVNENVFVVNQFRTQ